MARQAKITIRRHRPEEGSNRRPEWRWTWESANSLIIGASTEGYIDKADAIKNLQTISGGDLEITFRQRGPKGDFCQGFLHRHATNKHGATTPELVFVEVLP